MNQHEPAEWREASRGEACPVCEKPDWCSLTGPRGDADAVVCMRTESGNQRPNGGWLHRLRADHGGASPSTSPSTSTKPPHARGSRGFVDVDTRTAYHTAQAAAAAYRVRLGAEDRRWVYRDGRGEPALVVLRWDARGDGPKTIRPVSRTAAGEWVPQQPPAGRPLYRLPELLASDGPVCVAEGEPAADALVAAGFHATTSAGGSSAAGKTDWAPLAGRDVVILPDNDGPGQRYAAEVATRLAKLSPPATVRVVALPGLAPGGDAVDWFAAGHTADELRSRVAEAAPEEAPAPEPAEPPCVWRPFPTDALPERLARFVRVAARSIGCDESFVALPALAACAAAVGTSRRVLLKPGWAEPLCVWAAIVGESGSAKTPAFAAATGPFKRRQAELLRSFRVAKGEHERELAEYERASAEFRRSKGGGTPPEKPEAPPIGRVLVNDATVESLGPILCQNRRGVLLARDELAGWLDFGRYSKSGKGGGDAAHWLSWWSAQATVIDRRANPEPLFVPEAVVGIVGGVQPRVLDQALGELHRENGLAARLLLAYPPRRPKSWTEQGLPRAEEDAFERLLEALFDLQPTVDEEGEPTPVLLTLDAGAKGLWVEFVNAHGREAATLTGDDAAAYAKLEAYGARLAGVLHLVRAAEESLPNGIDADTIAAALRLVAWFKHETLRINRVLRESGSDRDRRRLAEWIAAHGGTATPRDVQQGCRWLKGTGLAESALADLAAHGWGDWAEAPTSGVGGRPTRTFRLAGPSTVYETPPHPEEHRGSVDVDNGSAAPVAYAPGSAAGASRPACDCCGWAESVEVPIHAGASVRRECARCGHLLGFPLWYGAAG